MFGMKEKQPEEPQTNPAETTKADESAKDSSPDTTGQKAANELSAEEVNVLREQAAKADEHWQRYLRSVADLENLRKRAAREKQDAIKFGNESILQKLIPVLDNLDMALAAAQSDDGPNVEALQTGVSMIQQQFRSVLAEAGLEEIDARGQPFDPNLHEAVSQQESTEVPEGHVMQQLRMGYRLKERLLRPASVIVAKETSQ
jgi:molecular chaperone GrpE